MPKNTMTDLRNHLFEVMEALKDKEEPMELGRAKVVVDVAQALIDAAKVEVDYLKVTESGDVLEFFDMQRIEDRRSLAGGPVPESRQRRLAS